MEAVGFDAWYRQEHPRVLGALIALNVLRRSPRRAASRSARLSPLTRALMAGAPGSSGTWTGDGYSAGRGPKYSSASSGRGCTNSPSHSAHNVSPSESVPAVMMRRPSTFVTHDSSRTSR